jgi:hypothetical protein
MGNLAPPAVLVPFSSAQETHSHSAPEKLGKVSFPISCTPAVQDPFDRGGLYFTPSLTARRSMFSIRSVVLLIIWHTIVPGVPSLIPRSV